MALFVLIVLIIHNCFTCLFGSNSMRNEIQLELKITPSIMTKDRYFGLYEVEDTLNLTCTFSDKFNISDVIWEWIIPSRIPNRENRVISRHSSNLVNLVIENLTESDSGEYICTASINKLKFLEKAIGISVKNKKGECPEIMFQCSLGKCIQKRYACDGFRDCPNGEDESPNYCGPGNPCDKKLRCPDERCIPYSWCCDSERERNCTTKVKHSCCIHMEKLTRDIDTDLGFQYEQHKFNDMGFLQTTVYTVIGCAMAFMFIVTIIVIAICRVHMRRSLLSRCPAANNRNVTLVRTSNVPENQLNRLPLYDLDVYFNRSNCTNNDLMSVNPLLITYNMNNGPQSVGRPVDPPPYCEVVTSPPREGPPPPYSSQENLCAGRRSSAENQEPKESNDAGVDSGLTESDALLDVSEWRNQISIISCNEIDGGEHITEFIFHDGSHEESRRNNIESRELVASSEMETDYISKNTLHIEDSNNSSHCTDCAEHRNTESNKTDTKMLGMLASGSHGSNIGNGGTRKVQNDESNSYFSVNVTDDSYYK